MEVKIVIGGRLAQVLQKVGGTTSKRRVATAAGVAALGAAVVAGAATVSKPHTFSASAPIVAAEVNENFDVIYTAFNDRVIRTDRTIALSASAGCDGIAAALTDLDDYRIASTATVTLELGAGTYACSAALSVGHVNARRLHIVGTGGAPGDVELTFPAGNGVVTDSAGLGRIANLTLTGGGTTTGIGLSVRAGMVEALDLVVSTFDHGVTVGERGSLGGSNLTVSGSTYGFVARRSGHAALDTVEASGNTNDGFHAQSGGSMEVYTGRSSGNGRHGFYATTGGRLTLAGPTAVSNGDTGIFAVSGAMIHCTGAASADNTSHGFVAHLNASLMFFGGSSATGNGKYGYAATQAGMIRTQGTVTASANTSGDYNQTLGTADNTGAVIIYQ